MAGMAKKMDENCWKLLKMAGVGWNSCKLLEMAGIGWNGWEWLEMSENG